MIKFFKNNWKRLLIGALVIIFLIAVIGGKNDDEGVTKYVVERGEVVDKLTLAGEVEPVQELEMAFTESGMIDKIHKSVGERVYAGEKIIELDNEALFADLREAEATLDLARAEAQVSNAELDVLVENARIKLYSDGLSAYSKDQNQAGNDPSIFGSYTGEEEGQYRVVIESSNAPSGLSFRYSGLEIGKTEINFYKAVPLGTRGLHLKFERGDVSPGDIWTISIPNVEGENYTENFNAYKSALASRDAAVSTNVSKAINDAKVKQAEAQIAKIRAQIGARTLTASFSGVVGSINVKVGEIVDPGTVAAKVLSEGAFRVVVQIPEVDVINLAPGLAAEINLDAYGEETIFPGKITSVDTSETEVDGVSVYEARAEFDQPDTRIRSGMSADVSITKEVRADVLRIPRRFIDKDETGQFVLVQNAESRDKVYLTTGLVGSDGFIEVTGGLEEGSIIVGEFKE